MLLFSFAQWKLDFREAKRYVLEVVSVDQMPLSFGILYNMRLHEPFA